MNKESKKIFGKKALIFIVEDNDMYSMMLEYALSGSNILFKLEQFYSGEECFENMHKKPNAVILDYFLPGMSGLDTFKKIKEKYPNIPVIILSSNKDINTINELLKEGVHDYIVKETGSVERLKAVLDNLIP